MCKYEIILHWSDDDGVYVAEVPELKRAPIFAQGGDGLVLHSLVNRISLFPVSSKKPAL